MPAPTSRRHGRTVPVLLAAAVLVGGANLAAYAADGAPLLLGHKNSATKSTTLKNKKGTALSLSSKAGTPSLKVSSSEKVAKLNSDQVDGLEGSALQNKTFVYDLGGTTATERIDFTLPGLPAGRYLATFNITAQAAGAATFACLFNAVTTGAAPMAGVGLGGGAFLVTGSGYLDTTANNYVLTCVVNDTGITVPAVTTPPSKSQLVLTRVDDVTTAASLGG